MQIVIYVSWPQTDLLVADWQCTSYSISNSDVLGEPNACKLLEAFQQAAAMQKNHEALAVSLVLPSELALLQTVQLPSRNQRQALQALPFVVEEQLAGDIEDVHLAVGLRKPDGVWPVMVVDVATMSAIVRCSEQAGLLLHSVMVDAQMLPVAEKGLTIAFQQERVLVSTENTMTAFDVHSATEMLHLFLGDTTPTQVDLYYSDHYESHPLLAQQLATEFSALGGTQVKHYSDITNVLSILLKNNTTSVINLLQGQFAIKQPAGKNPLVKWVVVAFLVLWLGQCAIQIVSGWYFNHRADVMDTQMAEQFKQLFPDARRVGNVRKQLESRLLEGASANNSESFSKLFSTSIQVLSGLKDYQSIVIDELRYDSQESQLELEVKAKSIDQLDQFKQAVEKAGLSAKISSANDSDGSITGRMQIGRGL
jgi:general secretion pathway protein L